MYSDEFINYQENKFESFCKKVIKNASRDYYRSKNRRDIRFSSLEVSNEPISDLVVEDTYITYSRTYKVKGIEIKVTDELIGEAIQYIMPNQRAVLLLSYFKELSDMDIARLMGISHKTVAYRKRMAIRKLKSLLEARQDAQEKD